MPTIRSNRINDNLAKLRSKIMRGDIVLSKNSVLRIIDLKLDESKQELRHS